jgi:hypothetical protein
MDRRKRSASTAARCGIPSHSAVDAPPPCFSRTFDCRGHRHAALQGLDMTGSNATLVAGLVARSLPKVGQRLPKGNRGLSVLGILGTKRPGHLRGQLKLECGHDSRTRSHHEALGRKSQDPISCYHPGGHQVGCGTCTLPSFPSDVVFFLSLGTKSLSTHLQWIVHSRESKPKIACPARLTVTNLFVSTKLRCSNANPLAPKP